MDTVSLLIGVAVGAVITFLILRVKYERDRGLPRQEADRLQAELSAISLEAGRASERATLLEARLLQVQQDLGQERTAGSRACAALAATEAELRNAATKLAEQKDELKEMQDQFTAAFKNLANEILEDKSRRFTDMNKEHLGALLSPLQDHIREFQRTISSTYASESRERATLGEQIRHLTELNQQITREASNLTSALKGQSKTQGDWGELILEQILERSGLVRGTHYAVQQSMKADDGKQLRPDVIIMLPDNKQLVIDAKVSLTAYAEYCKADDPVLQQQFLDQHIDSLRRHMKGLSEKNYQNLYKLQSVDFVLMFVPLEPAFVLAVKNDIALFNDAFDRNIVVVTTSTLLATLRTIGSIWRQENQSRNAMEIARKSGELYDKFVAFLEDLKSVGDRLQSARDSYDVAVSKLSTGRGNLMRRARELKEMGAKANKTLPAHFAEESQEDAAEEPGEENPRPVR